jgi:hypothetical protein
MAVNKVVINTPEGEKVIIDLTMVTVTPETLAEGVTAFNAAGELIIGTHKCSSNTTAKLGTAVLGTMKLGG